MASPETVAKIVEVAITAAPQHIRLIANCAVAVAPDALSQIQSVLAILDPGNAGDSHSAKGAKSAKAAGANAPASNPEPIVSNPLDFPGSGVKSPAQRVGPNPGTIIGPMIPLPSTQPVGALIPINPPPVTSVIKL